MQLDITDKKEQKLLSRVEVKGIVRFDSGATPSNDNVKEAIAKSVGKDMKLVVVKNIYTHYGASSADVNAYVYDNEAKLKELEEKHKKAKKGEGKDGSEEAPKEEAKPAEEKSAEGKE